MTAKPEEKRKMNFFVGVQDAFGTPVYFSVFKRYDVPEARVTDLQMITATDRDEALKIYKKKNGIKD